MSNPHIKVKRNKNLVDYVDGANGKIRLGIRGTARKFGLSSARVHEIYHREKEKSAKTLEK